ncbi:MAG: hypothetical protein ACI91G_000757 [Gammaproteobacteria bacterium]|jgi:hypothetical protein
MSNQLQRQYSHAEMAWFYGRIWLSGMVLATLGSALAATGVSGVSAIMLAATTLVYGGVSLLFMVIHTFGSYKNEGPSDVLKKVMLLYPIGIPLGAIALYLLSISR